MAFSLFPLGDQLWLQIGQKIKRVEVDQWGTVGLCCYQSSHQSFISHERFDPAIENLLPPLVIDCFSQCMRRDEAGKFIRSKKNSVKPDKSV